jgi:hypothetical protein
VIAPPSRIWITGYGINQKHGLLMSASLTLALAEDAHAHVLDKGMMATYEVAFACAPYVPLPEALAGEQSVYAADLLWHARQLDEDAASCREAAVHHREQARRADEAYDRDDGRYADLRRECASVAAHYREEAASSDATAKDNERKAHDCRAWALREATP